MTIACHLLPDDNASDHRPLEWVSLIAPGVPLLGGHASGKWSQTDSPAFDKDVRFMRGGHRKIVTRTEATASDFNSQITWPKDGWGFFHPARGVGHDCSVEWEIKTFEKISTDVIQLTDIRIHTEHGVLLEPCAATTVVLGHHETGVELEVAVAHLDLSNTQERIKANLEECHTLSDHYQHDRKVHPKRKHVLCFDGNRDQRSAKWVSYFQDNLFASTGLHSGWHHPLPSGGTHGKNILDVVAADF